MYLIKLHLNIRAQSHLIGICYYQNRNVTFMLVGGTPQWEYHQHSITPQRPPPALLLPAGHHTRAPLCAVRAVGGAARATARAPSSGRLSADGDRSHPMYRAQFNMCITTAAYKARSPPSSRPLLSRGLRLLYVYRGRRANKSKDRDRGAAT